MKVLDRQTDFVLDFRRKKNAIGQAIANPNNRKLRFGRQFRNGGKDFRVVDDLPAMARLPPRAVLWKNRETTSYPAKRRLKLCRSFLQ
jgi:hypothetical protein